MSARYAPEFMVERLREHDDDFECRCRACNGWLKLLAEWFGLRDGATAGQVRREVHAEGW